MRASVHLFLFCFIHLFFTVLFSSNEIFAYDIVLRWDANEEPDLAGYRLYSRIENPCPPYNLIDSYAETDLSNPLLPEVTVINLEDNIKYFFVVTAYDSHRNESAYSNIIFVQNGQGGGDACFSNSSGVDGGGGGGGGG